MRFKNTFFALFSLFFAVSSQGALVTLDNIQGQWINPDPSTAITSNSGQGADASIRWSSSGYDFFGVDGQSVSTEVPPSPSNMFALGTFQHVNQPVSQSIASVTLELIADITVDGENQGQRAFRFDFLHTETPNGEDPCPYGEGDIPDPNINGCADKVVSLFQVSSETFLVNGLEYTLNILGFNTDNGFVDEFLTMENATNSAELVANVTLFSDLVDVPEPPLYGLLALAVTGLFANRRIK